MRTDPSEGSVQLAAAWAASDWRWAVAALDEAGDCRTEASSGLCWLMPRSGQKLREIRRGGGGKGPSSPGGGLAGSLVGQTARTPGWQWCGHEHKSTDSGCPADPLSQSKDRCFGEKQGLWKEMPLELFPL